MKFRALLVTKDGFNCLEVQQHAAAVNQGLENLIHLPAAGENQVAAVFDLIGGILVMKPAAFLLFQIQGETQATAINPTLADLTESPLAGEPLARFLGQSFSKSGKRQDLSKNGSIGP